MRVNRHWYERTIHLRNGKKVTRVLYTNAQGANYIKYLGHIVFVEFHCGYWYEA